MSKNIKFEEAMQKLDAEVRRLESAELTIDEALASFEESVRLVKICNEKLEAAECRVRMLTESADGTVTDVPFGAQTDET